MNARRRTILCGVLCALVLPSAAAASAPRPRLSLAGAFTVSGHPVTVPGRLLQVRGLLPAGQRAVAVRELEGGRVLRRARLRSRRGRFAWTISAPAAGTVTVSAGGARLSFAALDEHVGFGSQGRFVELVQQRLAALHFYLPLSGVYDAGTGLAVDAYHRLLHRGTSQLLDHATIVWLLNGWGAFPLRYPRQGRHAEGDLALQLLALADGRRVEEIFPISSGKPSTPTVLGSYRVYRRTPGYLPDGMYYSSFFTGGYAIHGYDPAPDYPASHGCMRLPLADAVAAYDWLALGDWVDSYW